MRSEYGFVQRYTGPKLCARHQLGLETWALCALPEKLEVVVSKNTVEKYLLRDQAGRGLQKTC